MTVANSQLLSAGKGAELIRSATARSCTRQNLEKLCKQGKLPRSTASVSPVRVRPDLLVEEYLANVDQRQSVRDKPGVKDTTPKPPPTPPPPPEDLPAYNESRARSEYEKANLLELQRKTQEGLLLRREHVEQAWNAAVNITRTKLLGIPSVAKQRIPHLELEEVELLTVLLREALQELAAGEVTA
jgi:hypothetical protein